MRKLSILLSSLSVLALSACAPSDESKDKSDGSTGLGYELAKAKDGEGEDAQASALVDLTVEELRAKLDAGNIRLIDVRRADEVAQGMIPGAEHIALDQFDPAQIDFSDGRELVLYCRSGRRSGIAGERLASHTGEAVQHLAGGILAWKEAGEPITSE